MSTGDFRHLSVDQAVAEAAELLSAAGLDNARFEALALMGYVLGLSRARIYMCWREMLDDERLDEFRRCVSRRAAHEPFAHIVGHQAFYDIELEVTSDVLIPRPETEILVERALDWCNEQLAGRNTLRIADVGTGSGAIAIVLARHISRAEVVAVDVSSDALGVARRNVMQYGLQDRIHLVKGDLLSAMSRPFDLIAANLPYIPHNRIAVLQPEVRDHEPVLALDGGTDGLDFVRRLLRDLPALLARPGLCLLEIDEGQGAAVRKAALEELADASVSVVEDYAGLERFVFIER